MNFKTKEEKIEALKELEALRSEHETDTPSAFNEKLHATLNATVDGEVDTTTIY